MSLDTDPVPMCAALGDPTRWHILQLVGERGRSASDLADELPVSRQAIAKHLEALEAVGLVETERSGRALLFRAVGSRLSSLARDLEAIGAQWDRRLQRLAEMAEQAERDQRDR